MAPIYEQPYSNFQMGSSTYIGPKYNDAHPERRREYNKKRYQAVLASEELTARRNEYAKNYRQSHREEARERTREWRAADSERAKRSRNESRARHPIPSREAARRRKLLKKQVVGSHTLEDRESILRAQKNRCALCRVQFGKTTMATVDHIIPISKEGTDYRHNIQLLCGPCNSGKSNREQLEYARSIGRLL